MANYAIFDVDGTINQTHLYLIPAYREALKNRGIIRKDQEIISCIGMPVDCIAQELLNTASTYDISLWWEEIKKLESVIIPKKARTYPGVKRTIKGLKERGIKVAVCSNAYPDHISKILKYIGMDNCFDEVAGLDMGKNKVEVLGKLLEKLKPEKSCLIGDRKYDMLAARENAIPFIGCLYGYAPKELDNADYKIESPSEIIHAIETLWNTN
jgi:phosphoglycolate phosphatase